MAHQKLFLFALLAIASSNAQYTYEEEMLYNVPFPDGFIWGVGTSAYQVKFIE